MNTLTKSFAKRALSMLLAVIMVFSLGIVGITSASAAEVELAETGATMITLYFTNNKNWDKVYVHYWGGSSSGTSWPGTAIYYNNMNDDYGNGIYKALVPYDVTGVIFNNGNDGDNFQTVNITASTVSNATSYSGFVNGIGFYPTNLQSNSNTNYEVGVYTAYVAIPTISSAKVSVSGASTTGKAVTLNASYTASNCTPTIEYYVKAPGASSYTKIASTTSKSTQYTPTAAGEYSCYIICKADGATDSESSKVTFTVNPDVSITNVTATKGTEAVVGTPSTINYTYDVSGNSTEPEIKLLLNGTEFNGDYTVDKDNRIITFTPTVANMNYSFSVQVSVDGVTETSGEVIYSIRDEFTASLSVDTESLYVGDGSFTLTVTDNSNQYSTATYTLKKADGTVVDESTTGDFILSADVVGETTYYVTVTLSGEFNGVTVDTNKVTLTVMAKEFSVTLDAPKSAMEDRDFTITANVMFAPEGETLTYILTGSDGKTFESTDGVFTVVSNNPADVTYTVTVTASGGVVVTDTVTVTITVDLVTYPVKIFFKCSDTYGYLPNATVNGESVELTKYTAIESVYNASDTAAYSWYYYETAADVDFGTNIVFAVKANRVYFYNASYTVSAGEGDFVQGDDGYYYYYLALENLNGGSNTLSNISKLTEEQRNWTESAVNMIYDVDTDALAEVALNYRYANYGDANCDGDINIKDATYIQKSLAKMVDPSTLSTTVSDVNGDGSVTIKDATAIQKQLAGL